jgi:hypothetical protein
VEGRRVGLRDASRGRRRPQAALDVGDDVAQLGLGPLTRPAVLGAAERDEVPAAVGAKSQGEDANAGGLAFDDLAESMPPTSAVVGRSGAGGDGLRKRLQIRTDVPAPAADRLHPHRASHARGRRFETPPRPSPEGPHQRAFRR